MKTILLPKSREEFQDIYIIYSLQMDTDFDNIIKSKQMLSIEHIRYFVYLILRALKYLHSADIIHGNLVILLYN